MTWFFDELLDGTEAFDYGVGGLSSAKVPRHLRGVSTRTAPARNGPTRGSLSRGRHAREGEAPAPPDMFRTTVLVRRYGEARLGGDARVEVLVRFKDGTTETLTWDGRDRWTRFEFIKPVEAESAKVDPRGSGSSTRTWPTTAGRPPGPPRRRPAGGPAGVRGGSSSSISSDRGAEEGPMGVFNAIVNGMGTTVRKPRLLVILYVINLVFAVFVVLPLLVIVQTELGASLWARPSGPWTSCGSGRPCSSTWRPCRPSRRRGHGGALYLVLHIFLNGGIVGRCCSIARARPAWPRSPGTAAAISGGSSACS